MNSLSRKVLSVGDRLQKNFKRVLQSKPANYTFPENVVQAVYADRTNMTPKQKAQQTRLLKKYSADRYAKLYRETKVEYGDIEYSVKEWRKIPTQQRKELESEYKKWTRKAQEERTYRPDIHYEPETGQWFDTGSGEIVSDNQQYGEIVYNNFVDDFLSRLNEPTPRTFDYRGHKAKKWDYYVELSERKKATLLSLTMQTVSTVGKNEVGRRLAENADTVSRDLTALIYGSDAGVINMAYTELAYIITQGGISEQDLEDIGEQEEFNGVYN